MWTVYQDGERTGWADDEVQIHIEGPAADGRLYVVECPACMEEVEEDDGRCPECGADLDAYIPTSFRVNSAALDVGSDNVTVSISLGDPRGAFTMQLRWTDDGRYYLHVPHASDGRAHMPLQEVGPGTFQVG